MLKIIKIGGKVIEDNGRLDKLCAEVSAMARSTNIILVHGGGSMAGQLASRMGVETHMHQGRRITDAATLEITVMAYAGLANKKITARLQSLGVNACGLSGCDMDLVRSSKRPVDEGIDWGFVGDIEKVNTDSLASLLKAGIIPVISPITYDASGQLLNTNADSVASAVASAMAPRYDTEMVFCLDKPGVLADPQDEGSVIGKIDPALYEEMESSGAIHSGMVPKLENAFKTIAAGVAMVRITDADNLAGGTVVTD